MKPLPIRKLKDGLITATIWKNEIETSKFRYSVTFARAYLKDDQWHEAYSFSGSELLKLARLSKAAYDVIQSDKSEARLSEAVH